MRVETLNHHIMVINVYIIKALGNIHPKHSWKMKEAFFGVDNRWSELVFEGVGAYLWKDQTAFLSLGINEQLRRKTTNPQIGNDLRCVTASFVSFQSYTDNIGGVWISFRRAKWV